MLASGGLNNSYDIRSILDHEAGGHKNENIKGEYTFLDHAKVYLEQTKNSDYGNSTNGNQNSVAFGFMQRLWNAYYNKEISWQGMDPYINDFNSNSAGVKVIPIGGYDKPMNVVIQNDGVQSMPTTVNIMTNPHE